MEQFQLKVKTILEQAGFIEPAIHFDIENRRIEIFMNEGPWIKRWLPTLVSDLNQVLNLVAKQEKLENFFVDVNNYRKERERLIGELAKAAAKKATMEHQEVRLPAMNAYERRIIHLELALHPEVRTESEGEGKERCVIIKPI